MTPHEITEALHEALRLKLSGWELLLDTERAVAECNGIGAAWMGGLCDVITAINPAFLVPSMIHDIRYYIGGTEDDRKRADDEFLANCLAAVHDRYGWYNPLRYWNRRKALRYYDILRTAGKPAWHDKNFYANYEKMNIDMR